MEYILPAVFAGLATGFGLLARRLRGQVRELERINHTLGGQLAEAYEETEDERTAHYATMVGRNLLLRIVQAKAPEHIKYLDAETVEIYPTEFDIPAAEPSAEEEIGVYDVDDEEWARSLGYESAWPAALAVTDEE